MINQKLLGVQSCEDLGSKKSFRRLLATARAVSIRLQLRSKPRGILNGCNASRSFENGTKRPMKIPNGSHRPSSSMLSLQFKGTDNNPDYDTRI